MVSQYRLFKCLIIVLFIVSISASAIAPKVNSDLNMNNNGVFLTDVETADNTCDSLENIQKENEQYNLRTHMLKQDKEVELEEASVKKKNPNDLFNELPVFKITHPSQLPELKSYNIGIPLSVGHNDNPIGMYIPSNEPKYASEKSEDDTRGARAEDAGNDINHATQIKPGGNWSGDHVESHFDSGSSTWYFDDMDYFYIRVEEKGNLETELVEITIDNLAEWKASTMRTLVARIWDPISLYLHQANNVLPGEFQGKPIAKTDSDISISFLDIEITTPGNSSKLSAAPPVSGILLIEVYCLTEDIDIYYNLSSITKKIIKPVSNPYDMNNYPENGTKPQTNDDIQGSLLQNKDHWDWYDLSGFLEYTGPNWANKISYTLDITRQNAQAGSYHTWTQVWILYDSLDGSTLYLNGDDIETGGSPTVQVGGVDTVPIRTDFERYTGHVWLGIRSFSIVIQSGNMFPAVYDGGIDYTLDFDLILQNNYPILMQGKLEPSQDYYFMDDELSFYVKYRDSDDDAPSYVNITIDGIEYAMTGKGSNFDGGVTYDFSITGSELNDNFYPHTFNFSTSDGMYEDTLILSAPNNQFKVIEDQTPEIWPDAPKKINLDEDDDIYDLSFSKIFKDQDPQDGLEYSIKKGSKYVQSYTSPRLDVLIFNNKRLQFKVKDDQWGDDNFVVVAKETLKKTTLTGEDKYYFYATFKVNVSIMSVMDAPELLPISKVQEYQGELIYFPIQATDPDIVTDEDYLSFSTNRSDGKGLDDFKDFKIIPDTIDNTKANISFTPNNAHVGTFLVKVTVKDKDGLEDSRDVEFVILNTNDPPVIIQVKKGDLIKDTTNSTKVELDALEDEWFNISVVAKDIDISIGEKNDITFKLLNQTFENNVELVHVGSSSLTADIAVLPLNTDVGVRYINLSVRDDKSGIDLISIKVNVVNVNDPPKNVKINKPDDDSVWSIVDVVSFKGTGDDDDLYVTNPEENLTFRWLIKDENFVDLNNNNDILRIEFPTPYLPYNDKKLAPGNYTFRLEVEDIEGEVRWDEVSIILVEDYDNDLIPDNWEYVYGLDHRDRDDAGLDYDRDGFDNYEEYKAKTDPTDSSDKPSGKDAAADNSAYFIFIIIVIIVVIILLILFFVFRSKSKDKETLEDIESLAYPEEEAPGMPPMPPAGPPGPPGKSMAPGSMPPLPPPPPGVNPIEFHKQYLKMMKDMQQKPKDGQGPTTAQVQARPGPKLPQTSGLPPSSSSEINLKPKLPPGNTSGSQSNSDYSIKNDLKCPNCGISVQSGWFLCPGCKSPLN